MSTLRWSFTTRPLTEGEQAKYLAGEGLPSGVGYDPPKVALEYLPPKGEPWVSEEAPLVVKDAVGAYHAVPAVSEPGPLVWRGVGKDALGNIVVTTPLEELTIQATGMGGAGLTTVSSLVAAVLEDGQFDATEAQVLRWLNTRHRQMCARTRCYRRTLGLGVTVAEQPGYQLPPDIVEILQVTVGGLVYGTARHNDFAEGERGYVWLGGGEGGIAGREDSAAGVPELRLFPAPKAGIQPEPGAAIQIYAAMQPPVLTPGIDATLKVPDDFFDALVSGAIATGMLRVESRPDLADVHEQIFSTGCSELLRVVNRKFRGTGPARVRVVGINA